MRVPLAYIIRKTISVQTYSDYPTHETSDNEMITRMLHLSIEKTKYRSKCSVRKSKYSKVQDKQQKYL